GSGSAAVSPDEASARGCGALGASPPAVAMRGAGTPSMVPPARRGAEPPLPEAPAPSAAPSTALVFAAASAGLTLNDVLHLGQRILRPVAGTRRSSTWYGARQPGHSTLNICPDYDM